MAGSGADVCGLLDAVSLDVLENPMWRAHTGRRDPV
jgi:hypothetical protein